MKLIYWTDKIQFPIESCIAPNMKRTRIRLIFPLRSTFPISNACAAAHVGPFACLHHRKNLESKRVSLCENHCNGKDNVGATKARPAAINKFHPE